MKYIGLLCAWEKLTCYLYACGKSPVLNMMIRIDLVFVWVIKIDSISVWGIIFYLISVSG